MADDLLKQAQELFEGQIDFQGQSHAELLTTGLLVLSGFVALIVGYILKDIHVTLWVGLAGTLLAFLLVVPPWGVYKRAPVQWLKAERDGMAGIGIVVDGKKVN